MITGWARVCPQCGNTDGSKVQRIAFRPTFRCECGFVWSGEHAQLLGVFNVADATDAECEAIADLIVERLEAAARDHK